MKNGNGENTTHWDNARMGMVGVIAVATCTICAVSFVPDDPAPKGALRLSGVIMALGLLCVPITSSIGSTRNVIRSENVAAVALVYWALLDLILGSRPLPGISAETARFGLVLIGAFTCCFWIGVAPRAMRPPQGLIKISAEKCTPNTIFLIIIIFFSLCMSRYAIACKFDIFLMAASLQKEGGRHLGLQVKLADGNHSWTISPTSDI